ncbi:hypothetical protein EUTSA_v10006361mg [Eutrema salsugineum]|uniref:PsbP C-terminal domain-containing protein n=1 Tax=Eutrema salsugineum TaxID=72664 RepID=V4LV02_EUTSA|nr:hypothetical protein EUTSA_v10006361mg [Eutrema salsugineum]
MATKMFSASPVISASAATKAPLLPKAVPSRLGASLAAAVAATTVLTMAPALPSAGEGNQTYRIYYGTAASAANYGGYGGNSDRKTSAEYVYDVPEGWKERLVSKVEKGTNGTDSEFYNPKKRTEKEYLTFLSGFRQLAPRDVILNNLALSDDEETGQVYYLYEIEGVGKHSLITVTCAKNKLYAHFVNAPALEWNRDHDTLAHLRDSFKTV